MKNIKTFEGFFDFFKKKDTIVAPHSTYYWLEDEKVELEDLGFKFIDTRKTNSNDLGYFEFDGMFLIKTAIGLNGREDYKYELISNGKVTKEFTNMVDIKKWIGG